MSLPVNLNQEKETLQTSDKYQILSQENSELSDSIFVKYAALLKNWPEHLKLELEKITLLSPFVANSLLIDEDLMQALPELLAIKDRHLTYELTLKKKLLEITDETQFMRVLRLFRRQEMVVIAWRDFLSLWDIQESLRHLSTLAEILIIHAYHWQYQACEMLWGTPTCPNGEKQPMIILGMGKLGGCELNFSSDIDLIFTYPENGETIGAKRTIENNLFFTRLAQRLIKSLDQITQDGFCYRVDMRLRPFGESGPLVMSYNALEDYYQAQGRDWERYAMIKARMMGNEVAKEYAYFQQMLKPFVFRRYIDFSAIDALRRMKRMMSAEVRRRNLTHNIKLGAGGIREIEFIAQTFQLIRGGREPSLRGRSLLETLDTIGKLELLPVESVKKLKFAYLFFRRLENFLQAIDDKQTQTLPEDVTNQLRLTIAMGCNSWGALQTQIVNLMQQVHLIFDSIIGESEDQNDELALIYTELWDLAKNKSMLETILEQDLNIDSKEKLAQEIIDFKYSLSKKTIGPRGREVLDKLMPLVFSVVFNHKDAKFGLSRVLYLLEKIVSRTAYLELLLNNHGALEQLVRLCTASPMISEKLACYPILLDELLDPIHLYQPTNVTDYQIELSEFLARIPEEDVEQQMEALRQFKQIQILKIAAADVTGSMDVSEVSVHLSFLAQAIIRHVVEQAWQQIKARYGVPDFLEGSQDKGFGVIAYGKLGSFELGYHSDLDLVFVHQSLEQSNTNGEKQIDSFQFYLRLVQRIIHIFSMRMNSGILYEIDIRLRPSGEAGVLASHIDSFDNYYQNDAWTWEHQALVRTRMVYGNIALESHFNQIRKNILQNKRDLKQLACEVQGMREKMRSHLDKSNRERFALKQGRGGITDIEFLVQYWVLGYSQTYPQLAFDTENAKIIQTMQTIGLIQPSLAQDLNQIYLQMRQEIHQKNLLNLPTTVRQESYQLERKRVTDCWHQWLFNEENSS